MTTMSDSVNLEDFLTLMKGKPLGSVLDTEAYVRQLSHKLEKEKIADKKEKPSH